MSIPLTPLPYPFDALAPAMSAQTLKIHHDKHHGGYVKKLNDLIVGTEYAKLPIEEIILQSAKKDDKKSIYQNAAQIWNHEFFWNSMCPGGGGKPDGTIATLINSSFKSFDHFSKALSDQAIGQFGSGWIWLVLVGERVELMTTHDADLPLTQGKTALLCCDLWEHAYYLDFQNDRKAFVQSFLEKLANWNFATLKLEAALKVSKVSEPL
jgi:Fe-Mn family superoxide dismutase